MFNKYRPIALKEPIVLIYNSYKFNHLQANIYDDILLCWI